MNCKFLLAHPALRRVPRFLIALSVSALLWGAENTKKPISRERLLRAVEIGGLSTDEFVGIIREFGVDFEMNADDRASLSKAGLDGLVMDAIAENYRDPLREKITQLTEGGPLSRENIVGLLKAGAGSDIVEVLVEKRGVSFAMTPAEAKEIEAAGGGKALLGALLLQQPEKVAEAPATPPAPVPAAAPEPARTAEPVLVAAASTAAIVPPPQGSPVTPLTAASTAPMPQPAAPAPVTPPAATQQASATPAPEAAPKAMNQAAALLVSSARPAKLINGKVLYTDMARRAHAQGKVVMEIVINEQGRVENIKAISGNPLLVMSATQSLKDWIYEPASIDGKPIRVSTQVTVTFQ